MGMDQAPFNVANVALMGAVISNNYLNVAELGTTHLAQALIADPQELDGWCEYANRLLGTWMSNNPRMTVVAATSTELKQLLNLDEDALLVCISPVVPQGAVSDPQATPQELWNRTHFWHITEEGFRYLERPPYNPTFDEL